MRCDTLAVALLISTAVDVVHLGSAVNGFHASVCNKAELQRSEDKTLDKCYVNQEPAFVTQDNIWRGRRKIPVKTEGLFTILLANFACAAKSQFTHHPSKIISEMRINASHNIAKSLNGVPERLPVSQESEIIQLSGQRSKLSLSLT